MLFYVGTNAYSQQWQLFPKDSLRCYEVRDDNWEGYLKGMDYRSYVDENNATIFHLDSFSKSIYIPFDFNQPRKPYLEYRYLTGNSILGHRIKVTEDRSLLYFVNDSDRSEVTDSMLFLPNAAYGQWWLFYENDSVVVNACITSSKQEETQLGMDSVKHIVLDSYHKDDTARIYTNALAFSKNFGLIKTLDFDSLRKFDFRSEFSEVITLKYYREYTWRAYFDIKAGTKTSGVTWRGEWFDYTSLYTNKKYYENAGDVWYSTTTFQQDYNTTDGKGPLTGDTLLDQPYVAPQLGDSIINPIPNAYNIGAHRTESLCDGKLFRVRMTDYDNQVRRISLDSLGSDGELYDIALFDFTRSYVKGIGLETDFYRAGKGTRYYRTNIVYFKTPECTVGEDLSVFASVGEYTTADLDVYPNPVRHTLFVNNLKLEQADVSVYGTLGQALRCTKNGNSVDVSHLSMGIYFLEIMIDNVKYATKFIKQ